MTVCHGSTHFLATQVCPGSHLLPQSLQLFGSVLRLVSQPSDASPLQSLLKPMHPKVHCPAGLHLGSALTCSEVTVQAFPHAPQCLVLVDISSGSQLPSQQSMSGSGFWHPCVALQPALQYWPLQISPSGQSSSSVQGNEHTRSLGAGSHSCGGTQMVSGPVRHPGRQTPVGRQYLSDGQSASARHSLQTPLAASHFFFVARTQSSSPRHTHFPLGTSHRPSAIFDDSGQSSSLVHFPGAPPVPPAPP
jgi:hypothetical protein